MTHKIAVSAACLGLFAGVIQAGQLYGSVTSGGKPVASAAIVITCAGEPTKATTAADGSFRVTVTAQGRCTFALPGVAGSPSVLVFSYDKPTLYDLDLAKHADGTSELKVR